MRARIGVIGAGFWASYHYLPWLRGHPDAEVVGVVRKTDEGLDAFRRAFDLEVATTSVDELLSAGVDGVIVSSPHSLHREHAVAALEAGAHVLIEKPMTVTLADARVTAAAAARAGRTLTVAHGWNYSRLAIWAAETLEAGTLGRITSVSGYMASCLTDLFSGVSGYGAVEVDGLRVEAELDTWTRPEAGGGYLYGQLSHLLGLAFALVPDEPEEVFARATFLANGVDLDVHVSVRLAGGAIASFAGHGRLPWGRRHSLDLRVAGERGVLTLDFERERADVLLPGDPELAEVIVRGIEPPPKGGEGIYACEGPPGVLVDACLGRRVVDRAPAEVGVRAVAVMDAALRSARSGEPVGIAGTA